jgi:hypothetical protein
MGKIHSKKISKMKTKMRLTVLSSLAIIAVVMMNSCEKDLVNSTNSQYASVIDVAGDGSTSVVHANMQSAFIETAPLTDAEVLALQKMKEEEKLAQDVYTVLYQKWGNQIFSRISVAESNHINALELILENYGINDSMNNETGIFADSEIQNIYNDLIPKGSESIDGALKTSALIEEMDINDLKNALSSTSNANLIMVYENLERGSRNHLRAYNRQLVSLGLLYTPVYLSQNEFDSIVNSNMEKGKQYKMNGKGNGKGNGKENGKGKRGNSQGNGNGGNGQGMKGDGSCNS